MRKTLILFVILTTALAVLPLSTSAQDSMIECPEGADGSEVSILTVWSGEGEADFLSILAPVAEACNLTINHEGTRDLSAVLETRVSGGNPPDISVIPNPGVLPRYADQMVPLDEAGGNPDAYNQSWLDLGTVDGKWVGLFVKTDIKDLVWYSPIEFDARGYAVPTTWDEYVALIDSIASEGDLPPLSMGMESGAATGWTGTDTIQGILLTTQGLEFTNGLVSGDTAWNDPGVMDAWNLFAGWATDSAYALGGADGTLNTSFTDAIYAVFADPPEALMVRQSGFAGSTIATQYPDLVYGEDYAFFVVPGKDGEPAPMQIGADMMSVFNDTPAVEAIIAYLSSEAGGQAWAAQGFDLSPNKYAGAEFYEDPVFADKADALLSAPAVSFDVGDLLPGGMGTDEFENVTAVVNNTKTVEEAFNDLQARFEEVTAQ
jgi:alpha-glucoside transport system substrate-binding protein